VRPDCCDAIDTLSSSLPVVGYRTTGAFSLARGGRSGIVPWLGASVFAASKLFSCLPALNSMPGCRCASSRNQRNRRI
jgi:hypothetical protein